MAAFGSDKFNLKFTVEMGPQVELNKLPLLFLILTTFIGLNEAIKNNYLGIYTVDECNTERTKYLLRYLTDVFSDVVLDLVENHKYKYGDLKAIFGFSGRRPGNGH